MSLWRRVEGEEPIGRGAGVEEERRSARTTRVASGSLACPACDAPVALIDGPLAPADPLGCPFCGHTATTRDFLSLASPSRPARVEVHVRLDAGRRVGR